MGTITTTDGTEIFFKDWGSGQPIVFSHGWPLSADDWDTQMLFFLQPVPPLMVQTDANPGGLPKSVFDHLQAQLAAKSPPGRCGR
jgi:pimeloyl-ACP methyl ester carboxylesterase